MMDIKALHRGEPAHNPGSQVGAGDDEDPRKEQHELEWKQVALVIGTTFNSTKKNPFCRPPYQISPFVIIDVECRINVNSDWG